MVNDTAEPHFFCKLEARLGFTLHLGQRISRRKKIGVQVMTAIACKSQVSDPVRGVESAPHELPSCPDVSLHGMTQLPKRK
jgi:hypothetical protein